VSALKKPIGLIILSGLLIAVFFSFNPSPTVKISETVFNVEIADDAAERGIGLSGRDSLNRNSGMLFVFDQPGLYNFWMKDMNFALDFIWIDKDLKIIDIDSDVQQSSYPQAFTSSTAAKYVLEIAAGGIAANDIDLGSTVELRNIE